MAESMRELYGLAVDGQRGEYYHLRPGSARRLAVLALTDSDG